MLQRIQKKLGISLEGFESQDEGAQTGPASSDGDQISMAGITLHTDSSPEGFDGSTSNDNNNNNNNDMGPAAADFANFGMLNPNLVPMQGYMDTSASGPGQGQGHNMGVSDPWGVQGLQNGYDWVRFYLYFRLISIFFFKATPLVKLRRVFWDFLAATCFSLLVC